MIDWAATGQMISGLGTAAGAIAIVVAAFVGRNAVDSVRRQKQVERQIQHAEEALSLTYQLQSAISAIRSPMSTSNELTASREELDRTPWFKELPKGDQERTVQANVFYQRIRFFDDPYKAALSVMPFVKAYFGSDAGDALNTIIRARHSVRVYADAYAKDQGRDPEFSRKIERYVWEGAGLEEGDPVMDEVTKAVAVLERHLLPIIRESSKKKGERRDG